MIENIIQYFVGCIICIGLLLIAVYIFESLLLLLLFMFLLFSWCIYHINMLYKD